MNFFIALTALLLGFGNGMPVGNITDPSAMKHHLLHILEKGGKGGHKVHVDRQQNFEIIDDGKVPIKCTDVYVPGLISAVLLS